MSEVTMKICNECGVQKESIEFYTKKRNGQDKLYHICKVCSSIAARARFSRLTASQRKQRLDSCKNWRRNNPDRNKIMLRRLNLKKYGLTVEGYNEMLSKQNGVCAICGREEYVKRKGVVIPLSVDHNHKTGKIRGLLCYDCNHGLGKFRDSPETCIAAANYLRRDTDGL